MFRGGCTRLPVGYSLLIALETKQNDFAVQIASTVKVLPSFSGGIFRDEG